MREIEKLDAGLPYDFWDKEVNDRKMRAVKLCGELEAIPAEDTKGRYAVLKELFAEAGENAEVLPGFNCDYGLHIRAGKNFLANYGVTILDIAPVTIGDYVMIGPNTMITTVNHPLSPAGRRKHLGIAKPVTIGHDVWIGGGVTILPGVHIGNNVVIGASAVVTKDIPDNSVAAGVPARVIKTIENDIPQKERGY